MKFKKVYIEITNICNKNCPFCSITSRKKREMSIEEFKRVILEIKPFTDYVYLHVKGEPLLHSHFKEIIDICDENNVKVNITTNGSLLRKNKDIIINSKSIRQINISLHSYKENDNFKELFETVDEINKKTNIYIVYRYWILKGNNIDNYCISNLVDYYKFNNEIIEKIYSEMNIKINDTLYINKDEEFIWPDLNNGINCMYGRCYGLRSHIGILSDGTVVPCCLDADGIISLGNIFEKSLKDILNSERSVNIINGFKENKKIEELCRHCDFKKVSSKI